MSTTPLSRLLITQFELGQIRDHVAALAPEEACGLLAGKVEGDTCRALSVIPMTNMLHSTVRYRMEPSEQLAAFNKMEAEEMELIGIYHSHPSGPAEPSTVDVSEAYYPEAIYLIWNKPSGVWLCRAYTIVDSEINPVEILIYEAE